MAKKKKQDCQTCLRTDDIHHMTGKETVQWLRLQYISELCTKWLHISPSSIAREVILTFHDTILSNTDKYLSEKQQKSIAARYNSWNFNITVMQYCTCYWWLGDLKQGFGLLPQLFRLTGDYKLLMHVNGCPSLCPWWTLPPALWQLW